MNSELIFMVNGHKNITAAHKSTWQVTKEVHIMPRGDCIIGVGSNVACNDLPNWLKEHLRNEGKIRIEMKIGELQLVGMAEGHKDLTFEDNVDMVFRKSTFISPRTVAINSSIVAKDLPWPMIELLQNPNSSLQIKLIKV
ncbi:MAG: DUF371 domain-containing protein [Candidatus Heimdallarchaeota archaeon]|nr:DUF371 domain-containing protein [Candidatus Heimdallarchaeota archaeon]